MPGRAPNGCQASSSWKMTSPASGSATDTTCMAIRGRKNDLDTDRRRRWTRRALLGGGATLGSLAAAGYVIYRQFPFFVKQYINEMKIPIEPAPKIPDPRQWPDRGIHAAWLGHSTVLMKIDGFTVLTDPVFSD